jgi:signal transduction histidine kinase
VVTAIYPQVRVESLSTEGLFIPNEVALALTESVMQAVDNSVRHAGPKADTRLKIEGLHAGLKVVVADNGRGFRLSNAGRGQVGVHRSIIERSRSVGVRPSVDTQPGEGCRVVLQWVKA